MKLLHIILIHATYLIFAFGVQPWGPKNEISGLERPFFDFRGMIMALLAFDNQKYCTFI